MATTLLGAAPRTTVLEDIVPAGQAAAILAAILAAAVPGDMSGLRMAYGSATTITIEAGDCRDSTNTYKLSLAALVTVSMASTGALGINEVTLAATATTHGTATFEPSASIWDEAVMTATVRTLSGTWSTSGTAATGSGGDALRKIAVGDLVRIGTKGASRCTAIADNNAFTLVAALPGGNASSESATFYENKIVRIAAETPQRVNTISHAGTSVVVGSSWSSSTSGVTIKLGGEIVYCIYNGHIINGGSGTSATVSAQRTKPYPITGYSTATRFVGSAANMHDGNLAVSDTVQLGPNLRYVAYDDPSNYRVLNGGTLTSWADVDVSYCVPITSGLMQARFINVYSSTVRSLYTRMNGGAQIAFAVDGVTSVTTNGYGPLRIRGGAFEYQMSGAGSTGYVDVQGYWEAL